MCQQTQCLLRILDQDVSYSIFRIGEVLTIVQDNDRSTFFHARWNERVPVNCSTCLRYKQIACFDLARVELNSVYIDIGFADNL